MFDESFTKRPTNITELQFAKVGVFNPIHIQDTLLYLVQNKIPEGGFWEYHNLRTGTDRLVCPVRSNISRKYTGKFAKRKLRTLTANFETSPVSYTAHALQRFYERTGYRNLTHNDFFIEASHWFEEMQSIEKYTSDGEVTIERSDFMVPFREGAFLGHIYLREDYECNKHKVDFKSHRLISRSGNLCSQTSFAALTYIRESQMFPSQLSIFEALKNEDFSKARDLTERSVSTHYIGVDPVWSNLLASLNKK